MSASDGSVPFLDRPNRTPELTVPMMLGMIQDYAKFAQEALADEHEANVRYFVRHMAALAAQVQFDVADW